MPPSWFSCWGLTLCACCAAADAAPTQAKASAPVARQALAAAAPEQAEAEPAGDLVSAERATVHIYQLAGRDELAQANRFASVAVSRFPDSSPLWEATGFVRRGASDYAGALDAYRRAAQLQPSNSDAIKGQALMLRKLGAVAPAAEVVAAHPELGRDADLRAILAEQAALELRYAEGVEDPVERQQRLQQVAARLDELADLGGGQIEAARRGESAAFDRIQADVLLHHESDATHRYERLQAAGVDVPAYARYQAAVAYARLRQSAQAIRILRDLVEQQPDDVNSQLELFYVRVDADQLTAAREQVDRVNERLAAASDRGDGVRVRVAGAMVRAYDEHPAQALAQLDRLLEEAPFSADARTAHATVCYWRGWTRRARDEADAVLTVAPHSTDARALRIQTDMALDDWAGARAALRSDSAGQDLTDRDRLELTQRLGWHDRPQVTIEAGYGSGSQTNLATYQDWVVDSHVYSAPIEDRYRFFGHLRYAHTDVAPSSLERTWGGAGVEASHGGLAGSLELAGVQGEPGPAAVLRGVWQPLDGARLTAQGATSDPDTPARASINRIRERTLSLSGGYEWNESTGMGVDVGFGQFTDTNRQLNTLLRASQRLAAWSRFKLTWNAYVGYSHDTLSAARAPYFDPPRATSEESELRAEWLARRDPAVHRSLWHVVTISFGNYQQAGFGAHSTWAARYEPRWSLSDHSELGFSVARSEHPYDGRPESRTSVSANYEGRF